MEFVPVFYTTSSNGEDVGSAIENVGLRDFEQLTDLLCDNLIAVDQAISGSKEDRRGCSVDTVDLVRGYGGASG